MAHIIRIHSINFMPICFTMYQYILCFIIRIYPCIILYILYSMTFGAPPLYYAISCPNDTSILFVWRILVIYMLYLPCIIGYFDAKIRWYVILFIMSCTIFGQNTHILWNVKHVYSLQVFEGISASILAGIFTYNVCSHTKTAVLIWFGITIIGILHSQLSVRYGRIICAIIECIWCAYVHFKLNVSSKLNCVYLMMRILILLLLIPLSVVLSIIPLEIQTFPGREVNFAGQPLCNSGFKTFFPISLDQVQDLFANYSAWPIGSRHSWSNALCPPHETSVLVDTKLLNSIEYIHDHTYKVQAGVKVEYIANYLLKYNNTMNSRWHGIISGGGAIAGCIHNEGIRFFDMIDSIRLVTHDGKLQHVTRQDLMFESLCGSAGKLGIVFDFILIASPLQKIITTTNNFSNFEYAHALWVKDNGSDIYGSRNNFYVNKYTHTNIPLLITNITHIYAPNRFLNSRLSFEFFNSIFHFASVSLYPVIIVIVNDAIQNLKGVFPWKYIYTQTYNLLTTYTAATELDVVVQKDNVVPCIHKILMSNLLFKLHIRHCAKQMDCAHIDFSIPIFLLYTLKSWFQNLIKICKPVGRHVSKMTLEEAINAA